ncbi:MAG: hypothetical protein V3T83_02730 [Acidobacteriota bacterium]
MRCAPEDVLVLVLHYLYAQGVRKFESDPAALHPIFFEARQQQPGRHLFSGFVFDTRDYFPFSETVEEALDALQFSGYLERSNPKGVFFEILPHIEGLHAQVSTEFTSEELESVKRFAESLSDRIAVKSSN